MSNDDLSTAEKIRQEIDELVLQLSLGRREAADFIEEQKDRFRKLIDETRQRLSPGSGDAGEEASTGEQDDESKSLRQRLDELKLQLTLGKMEGRDAYEAQREKISDAIGKAQEELDPLSDKAGKMAREAAEAFREGARVFKDKLDAFALDVGLGSVIAEDAAEQKKSEFASKLRESADKLKPAVSEAGGKIREAAGEAKEVLKEMREGLAGLFRRE